MALYISDPELLQDLYTTQNNYNERHDLLIELFKPLMGNAVFLDKGETWRKKRKSLTSAFYKE